MATLRNTLFNSLLRKENICCLCLNVEQNTIHIRDEVLLNGNDFDCTVIFSEVLGYILGDDVSIIVNGCDRLYEITALKIFG